MYCLDITGPAIFDYNKRLILLSVVQLSGGHYILKNHCKSSWIGNITILSQNSIELEGFDGSVNLLQTIYFAFLGFLLKSPFSNLHFRSFPYQQKTICLSCNCFGFFRWEKKIALETLGMFKHAIIFVRLNFFCYSVFQGLGKLNLPMVVRC